MTRIAPIADATGMSSGSIAGGFVLTCYGAAIVGALFARRRAPSAAVARAWLAIAVLLGALAFEKAFHVETLLLRRAEGIARAGGWYAQRGRFQLRAIGVLAAMAAAAVTLIAWWLRRAGTATRIAAVSAVLIAAFVLVRAVSFHRLDRLLATGVGPLRVSNVVELAGLGVVGLCAWAAARAPAHDGG